jgi:hypothetical protein
MFKSIIRVDGKWKLVHQKENIRHLPPSNYDLGKYSWMDSHNVSLKSKSKGKLK